MRLSLGDYARLARERLDQPVWDFFEGGAGQERTLLANPMAFDRVRLRPSVLSGVTAPDLQTKILGRTWQVPLAIAPMGYQTLAHPEGELATVRAAGPRGVPVVVSMFAGRGIEDLAAVATAPLWLQIYCLRDRATIRHLVERAERAGFEALVFTVDTPHLGRRLRDLRNRFRLPPHVGPANLQGDGFDNPAGHALTQFDPAQNWDVVHWLRSITRLPIVLKGILTGGDSVRAISAGADGIIVSNHGGRQLDGAPASLEALPEVVAAVGGACTVLLDGGVRRGADVLAARAMGADAVLLGRPVLYGLAVDGEDGVARVIDLLIEELTDVMTLTGTASMAAVPPELVRPSRLPGTSPEAAVPDN